MNLAYWTESKGIGGKLLKEEDFLVEEVIDSKFLRKFRRISGRVAPMDGKYSLYILEKRGENTRDAIKQIEKFLRTKDIGYAGLKDKNAITKQYVTIGGEFEKEINLGSVKLTFLQKIDKHIAVGDLIGNNFTITLHGIEENPDKIINEILEKGIPNYFGPQRFGVNENNHIAGKFLIKREFKKVGEKEMLKFYIHAYQSWIFNKVVEEYIENRGEPYFYDIDIVGFDTKLKNDAFGRIIKNMMKKEGITTDDFEIKELKIKCMGGRRKAFIKIDRIDYEIRDKKIILKFFLPKGSYATVLIREITKQNLYP